MTRRPRGGAHGVARPTDLGWPSGSWAQLAAFCGHWLQPVMRTRRLGGQVIAKWAAAVVALITSASISMELRAADPKPPPETMPELVTRWVVNPTESNQVAVEVALEDQERRWLFTPAQPWKAGPHTVLVQTTIEDLAGNNIGKAFEVDLFENVQRGLTNLTVKLSFEPTTD